MHVASDEWPARARTDGKVRLAPASRAASGPRVRGLMLRADECSLPREQWPITAAVGKSSGAPAFDPACSAIELKEVLQTLVDTLGGSELQRSFLVARCIRRSTPRRAAAGGRSYAAIGNMAHDGTRYFCVPCNRVSMYVIGVLSATSRQRVDG